jgi:hypothetical protein
MLRQSRLPWQDAPAAQIERDSAVVDVAEVCLGVRNQSKAETGQPIQKRLHPPNPRYRSLLAPFDAWRPCDADSTEPGPIMSNTLGFTEMWSGLGGGGGGLAKDIPRRTASPRGGAG